MSLAFLHTVPSNVGIFRTLLQELAPGSDAPFELIEDVLQDAVTNGVVSERARELTAAAVKRLADKGASLIVCTCSTIGGIAEATPVPPGVRVLRIDRAMVERAVASRRRIIVAAALPSTFAPTLALIDDVAGSTNRAPDVKTVLCEDAWPHLVAGDRGAYAQAIARHVVGVATPLDIVVLAQASMAPAAPRIEAAGITALASPEIGLRSALALLNDPR